MAQKCWKFIGQGVGNNDWYEFFFCGETATSDGQNMIVDGVSRQALRSGTVSLAGAVSTPISRDPQKVANDASRGNCDACSGPENQPGLKYDCINSACISQNTYDTPGIYQSLSDCEEACGPGCSGVCISNAEWSAIQGLAAQHLAKDCGGG